MFTTFQCDSRDLEAFPTDASSPQPRPTRKKRKQVSRACDWCRTYRIKCDDDVPCHQCRSRGGVCSSREREQPQTLPQATREIERLELRIKDLEAQLDRRTQNARSGDLSTAIPSTSPAFEDDGRRRPQRRHWEGVHVSSARSNNTEYYGPASSFYFLSRMSSYLAIAFQQPHSEHHMQPNSASRCFTSPFSIRRVDGVDEAFRSVELRTTGGNGLSRSREEYFVNMYWQSYHCTMPIIDENEFRKNYKSLWVNSTGIRKPSALVDIILALCLQYGAAFFTRGAVDDNARAVVDTNDATIAGRHYYQRCQDMLTNEMESPSLVTVQCQLLAVVYECNGSFQNMAHSTLALAVRNAQILGLHLEPPNSLSLADREFHRRLWWTLYAIELKTSMKLGRPWSVNISQVSCSLPSDSSEAAAVSGSEFSTFGENVTWLSFGLEVIKLFKSVENVYTEFYNRCAEELAANEEGESLYDNPTGLEACAEFLLRQMRALQLWVREVPQALKIKRRGFGEAFTTDRSALDVEGLEPLWVQRQRLILELLYHHLSINLYRPFICFNPTASSNSFSSTPYAERASTLCVNHAIALTQIIHQVVSETDVLNGWHETYQWQWNATVMMIGFILAYPVGASTPSARAAIDRAVAVFKTFGNNFAVAASAANVARDLTAKADFLVDRFRADLLAASAAPVLAERGPSELVGEPSPVNQEENTRVDNQDHQTVDLGDSVDLAFTVDSFTNFEAVPFMDDFTPDAWSFARGQ